MANSGNKQFDVTFATQTAGGTYTFQLGSLIKDPSGNALQAYRTTFAIPVVLNPSSSQWAVVPNLGKGSSTVTVNQDLWIQNIQVRLSISEQLARDWYRLVEAHKAQKRQGATP